MSEYAKNIQTIEDMWKKRIELRRETTPKLLRNYSEITPKNSEATPKVVGE